MTWRSGKALHNIIVGRSRRRCVVEGENAWCATFCGADWELHSCELHPCEPHYFDSHYCYSHPCEPQLSRKNALEPHLGATLPLSPNSCTPTRSFGEGDPSTDQFNGCQEIFRFFLLVSSFNPIFYKMNNAVLNSVQSHTKWQRRAKANAYFWRIIDRLAFQSLSCAGLTMTSCLWEGRHLANGKVVLRTMTER